MADEKAVPLEEAARLLGASKYLVRQAIREKQLFARKLGHRWIVPMWAIDMYLAGDTTTTEPAA